MARVEVHCAGAAGLVQNPNAPGKIRGAWGRALAGAASTEALGGGPCRWSAPCAYDVFFNNQGRLTARLEIPKPYLITLDAVGDDLRVVLTIFGMAADWAGEAADGLVRALRAGLDSGGKRRPFTVANREIGMAGGIPTAPLAAGASLRFRSPVALREGSRAHVEPAAMITSLANRVSGLARWHGVRLEIDAAALKAEAQRLGQAAEWVEAAPVAWRRGSAAQQRQHGMVGLVGEMHLPPPSASVAALLSIGAVAHIGSRTTFGMGRYDLLTFAKPASPAG
jgi:hypothetical protein